MLNVKTLLQQGNTDMITITLYSSRSTSGVSRWTYHPFSSNSLSQQREAFRRAEMCECHFALEKGRQGPTVRPLK